MCLCISWITKHTSPVLLCKTIIMQALKPFPVICCYEWQGWIGLKFVKVAGCKESQFYSLPFGQAVASMYWPTSHFNQPPNHFLLAGLITIPLQFDFPKKQHLPVQLVKNKNHQRDRKIHQPLAIGHDFLCMLLDRCYQLSCIGG